MATNKHVPNIRFVGFNNEWHSRKIGEVLAEIKRPIELKDNESYQLVTVKRRNEGVVPRAVLKGKNILVKNYFTVKAGDYLVSKRQVVHGANGIVPENLDNAVVSNEYLVVTDNDEITAQFWTETSKRPEVHKLFFLSSYGVDIEKLVFDVDDWKNREIFTPKLPEQKRITSYFRQLNNLITQHQQKHDKLSNLKKAMLEKMFPKAGGTFPEIRFDGFSGDWKTLILGEHAQFAKGQGYSKKDLKNSGTPIILYGRLYTRYETIISNFDTYAEKSNKSLLSKGGEVIVPASGESPEDIARAAVVEKPGVIIAGDLNVISPGERIKPSFIALSISYGNLQREISRKAQGKSVVHIRNSDLIDLEVKVPSTREQSVIGNYFQKLDKLINQHQDQLTKLNHIKQACLNKMFV